jgi:hypothetical protein
MLKSGRVVRPPTPHTSRDRMKDSQLKALIRKTTGKAQAKKNPNRPSFDATIDATRREEERSGDAREIFNEMKRREF